MSNGFFQAFREEVELADSQGLAHFNELANANHIPVCSTSTQVSASRLKTKGERWFVGPNLFGQISI